MTTITIEVPDYQAAVLRGKAAAEGLSIGEWLLRRTDQEILGRRSRYTLAELVEQCDPQAPLSAEDREWMGSSSVDGDPL